MTASELKADRKKRRRFSAFVATLSILIGISLYLGITNAVQQDSNTGRIGKLERPSPPELAERLKRGIQECFQRKSCFGPVLAELNRAGRANPTRRRGSTTRTPASGPRAPGTGGQNGGSNGGPVPAPPSQPTPTPRRPPSQPTPTPQPRPQVHLPAPLPTVTVPGPVCVPDPLHAGLRVCTP